MQGSSSKFVENSVFEAKHCKVLFKKRIAKLSFVFELLVLELTMKSLRNGQRVHQKRQKLQIFDKAIAKLSFVFELLVLELTMKSLRNGQRVHQKRQKLQIFDSSGSI